MKKLKHVTAAISKLTKKYLYLNKNFAISRSKCEKGLFKKSINNIYFQPIT